MKITCNVIKDLLPLYHDKICSEDSRKIVEEHLVECDNCRKELAYMSGDFTYDANLNEEKLRNNLSKSVKKLKFTNILLGFLVSLCLIGIIAITLNLAFVFFIPSIDKCKYQYNLESGFYEVGTHVPAGKYRVQLEEGSDTNFEVYKFMENVLTGGTEYDIRNIRGKNVLVSRHGRGNYYFLKNESKLRYLTLSENQIICVHPNSKLVLYTNKIANPTLDQINIELTKSYYNLPLNESNLPSNSCVAGEDFDSGVYDILYNPTDVNHKGTIQCEIKFDGGEYYSSLTLPFECDGSKGEQIIFRNIPFTPESIISVYKTEGISLVPTENISNNFNQITWESDSQ